MRDDRTPVPFEIHESGALLHGTKAQLEVGDLLVPGRPSNYEQGRIMNHVYVTETLDAAAWGAEMAPGDERPRIYVVEPLGDLEDDPNVTDKKLPGNPTRSFRSREPVHRGRAGRLGRALPRADPGDARRAGRAAPPWGGHHLRLSRICD
jgi:rifampin ADP-ribosylating transferase